MCQAHIGESIFGAHPQHLEIVDALDQAFEIQKADDQWPQLPRRAHEGDELRPSTKIENRISPMTPASTVSASVADEPHVLARDDGVRASGLDSTDSSSMRDIYGKLLDPLIFGHGELDEVARAAGPMIAALDRDDVEVQTRGVVQRQQLRRAAGRRRCRP